jgi:hypothetical protein
MNAEVVVRKFDAPHEAELAACYLREHGVRARIENDVLANMNPLWGMALGGVRLIVRERDVEEAVQLLDVLAKPLPASEVVTDPARASDNAARRAMAAAVIGTFILPVVSHLYSLSIALPLSAARLSPKGRRNRTVAIVVDALALALCALLLAQAQ